VAKGARNRDVAFRYINSCLNPERQANFAKIMTYSPVVKAADKLIPADIKKVLPDPANPDNCIENLEWWADKNEELTKRFKEWQMV
jgi:putative spermidine/putrescine transport system substrate-binding protein